MARTHTRFLFVVFSGWIFINWGTMTRRENHEWDLPALWISFVGDKSPVLQCIWRPGWWQQYTSRFRGWNPAWRWKESADRGILLIHYLRPLQVYNRASQKGLILLLGTHLGLFLILIPGLFVWIYSRYDAYLTAGRWMRERPNPGPCYRSRWCYSWLLPFLLSLRLSWR